MLRLSYFPTRWKFTQITMIPKPGKPANEVTSYRPIPSKLTKKFFSTELETTQKFKVLHPTISLDSENIIPQSNKHTE
jgi:hypothetical protein